MRANGPYKVVGPVTIVDAEGREFELPEGTAVALCRCGHSQTKPFCDASHKRVGFVADDTATAPARRQTRQHQLVLARDRRAAPAPRSHAAHVDRPAG